MTHASRSRWRLALAVGAIFLATTLHAADDPKTSGKPPGGLRLKTNVLILILSDVGPGDVGCYGANDVSTPNIDRLAKEGVRFSAMSSVSPVGSPARAGILTGRYPQRFGHEFDLPGTPRPGFIERDAGIDPRQTTLGEAFRALGYRTMFVGAWGLGTHSSHHPRFHGFDEFFGFLGRRRSERAQLETDVTAETRMYLNEVAVPDAVVGYLTDDLAEATAEFVRETFPDPWFVMVSFNSLGDSPQPKPELLREFAHIEDPRRREFAATLKSVDETIGRILHALDAPPQVANTLVLLVGDNGGSISSGARSGPRRGERGTVWEGGLRVPGVMRWPARLTAGTSVDEPVSTLDLFPTALRAVGEAKLSDRLDGVDLLPFLTGSEAVLPQRMLFWRRGTDSATRRANWKLIHRPDSAVELYDLGTDPGERHNQAAEHPKRVAELLARLIEWEQQLSPPRWSDLIPTP